MNPFVLMPYAGEEWFCDRGKETEEITRAIRSGRHMTLHSIRRMGKTGLIMHVQDRLPKKYVPVYIDVLDTRDEADFANKFITSVVSALENRKNLLRRALEVFARFRASVVLDPVLGTPTISLDIREKKEARLSLQLLWKLMASEKKLTFQIAVDEFQQIVTYSDSSIDAGLREAMQTLPNVHFIFSGSQKHILMDLFSDARKALFKTAQLYELSSIGYPEYMAFIRETFSRYDKEIDDHHIHHILDWTRAHTYYVQYFCHLLFEKSNQKVGGPDLDLIKRHIFVENEGIYYQFQRLLTPVQWRLLSAVAHENILRKPLSTRIRDAYDLGAPGSVSRSLDALLEKEMIYVRYDPEGQAEYLVYDVFLSRWIASREHRGKKKDLKS